MPVATNSRVLVCAVPGYSTSPLTRALCEQCHLFPHPQRPPRDRLGGGRPEGGRGPPGDEAFDVAGENEKTRNLPAPIVPARRHLYRPGGTSYLALSVLAAIRLDRQGAALAEKIDLRNITPYGVMSLVPPSVA